MQMQKDGLEALAAQLLGPHQVRKTRAQKRAFERFAGDYAAAHGVPMRAEEGGRWVKSRNLVFGDVGRARVLITAHYDTCARLPLPNVMTPLCWPLIVLTQFVLLPAALVAVGLCAGALASAGLRAAGVGGMAAMLLAALAFALGIAAAALLMIAGPANPHTANDNTSGVLLVLLAAAAFAHRDDVACVLFDNEEKGLLGASAFAAAHPAAAGRAFLVQCDCVGDGDTLLYTGAQAALASPQGKRMADALCACARGAGLRVRIAPMPGAFYPSDQLCFARGTALAALRGRNLLYLSDIHTARDVTLDRRNIRCLLGALRAFLGEDGEKADHHQETEDRRKGTDSHNEETEDRKEEAEDHNKGKSRPQ